MKPISIFIAFLAITYSVFAYATTSTMLQREDVYFNDPIDPDTLIPIYKHPNAVRGALYTILGANSTERVRDLIRRMTFEEKLLLTGGWNKFMFNGVERLGVRAVSMVDGGQGVRLKTAIIKTKSTSFPGGQAIAATWNKKMSAMQGKNLGEECRALGADILLGPGINIQRLSVGGRNFEYFGEDPYLTKVMAVEYISALQAEGIIAVPKHFIGNDQDFCRHIASSNIDDRTLREIYLAPWEGVFTEAGCKGMMTGNNLVNGTPSYMSRRLIENILRSEYGFSGIAMTDWQNSSYYPELQQNVITSGETLMMPENTTLMTYISQEIDKSPQRMAEIEIMVERMIFNSLLPLFESGIYDRASHDPSYYNTFEDHKNSVRTIAEECITMLKNEGSILPIPTSKKILLMGKQEYFCGKGSGFVTGYDHVNFEDGLRSVYGNNLVRKEKPSDAEIKASEIIFFSLVKDTGEGKDIPFDDPEDQLIELRRVSKLHKNVIVLITAANTFPMDWVNDVKGILWCYYLGQERGNALVNIISGRVSPSGKLPFTIERSFADSPAPTYNYLNGKPYWRGNNEYRSYWLSLADKTLVDDFSDMVKPGEILNVPYNEGVFVGYRWYDKTKIPVVYPFGYGLSYTTFEYKNIRCENKLAQDGYAYVSVDITNKGGMQSKEIVQLYVSDIECSVERPIKELKAFEKISLQAGETKTVTLKIDSRALSFWYTQNNNWKIEKGDFRISVGSSSAELPLTTIISY